MHFDLYYYRFFSDKSMEAKAADSQFANKFITLHFSSYGTKYFP